MPAAAKGCRPRPDDDDVQAVVGVAEAVDPIAWRTLDGGRVKIHSIRRPAGRMVISCETVDSVCLCGHDPNRIRLLASLRT